MAKLESIGRVLLGGWGDKMVVGFLREIFDRITPGQIISYIQEDKSLFYWAKEKHWAAFRRRVKEVNFNEITRERVLDELGKRRLDLAGAIINQPKGPKWLDNQIAEVKKRLSPG